MRQQSGGKGAELSIDTVSLKWIAETIEYTYDKAGQVLTERNTVIGSGGPAQTNYYRYGNGDVAHIQYPNGTLFRREYTARGQLALVQDEAGQQPVHYFYLRDGKVNYQTFANGTTTAYAYDGRGMINAVHHKRTSNGQNLSYRDYWRRSGSDRGLEEGHRRELEPNGERARRSLRL
jgi:hypothetical protein